ncbi:MAG: hypothetical protein QM770_11730 [Tepidisphaeraceae bacterium]
MRLGLSAGVVSIVISALSVFAKPRAALVIAAAAFLVGGQIVALVLVRVYNREWMWAVYDSFVLNVLGCLARFAWIAVLAGLAVRSRGWRWLREMAGVDGASSVQTNVRVILPLSAGAIVGCALLVTLLSMTEVPASVLLKSGDTLVPLLMAWVHTANFDPMIGASLLLLIVSLLLGAIATALLVLARWNGVVDGAREIRITENTERTEATERR